MLPKYLAVRFENAYLWLEIRLNYFASGRPSSITGHFKHWAGKLYHNTNPIVQFTENGASVTDQSQVDELVARTWLTRNDNSLKAQIDSAVENLQRIAFVASKEKETPIWLTSWATPTGII